MNRAKKAMLMAVVVIPPGPLTRVINHDKDDPGSLVPGHHIEMNLKTLDEKSKRSVPQRLAPWSDVGWKANKGLVLERYNDDDFESSEGWGSKHRYLLDHSASRVLRLDGSGRGSSVAMLSPAEKYDLVMGTVDDGLARNIGSFLDQTIGDNSSFPSWWGLCEGSAPASSIYPEPVKKVVLHSETYDVDVPFYAPDIKGLATMLWSRFNSILNMPESGTQCRNGDEDSCFDTNPASFHAAVHHFLDLSPGILVGEMDPTPVVWNYPLVSYSESYYRPDRGSDYPVSSLSSALVSEAQWDWDPRKAKRSQGTAYVVGIKMDISYAVNQSQRAPNEGSSKRKINSRTIVYELELDSSYNMLGGEWLAGDHPDLLWAVPKGTVPDSPSESLLPPGGAEQGVIPKTWTPAARASAQKLTPLRRVVELLIDRSSH